MKLTTTCRTEISDPEQIEDIVRMINDMGITVHETAPDADDLLTNEENTADEVAAEEAAAALAAVENEVGRTTDPVRMYMREMGTVELLTREGEIAIAKRIEEGIRDVLRALAFFPGTVDFLLDSYTHCVARINCLTSLLGILIRRRKCLLQRNLEMQRRKSMKMMRTNKKGPIP